MSLSRPNLFAALDILKSLGILLLVLMFIHFNSAVARQSQDTKNIAANTNHVVKSQDDILRAIKQVTDDTRITAAQQTAIIICMLQVPVTQRTTDLQARCQAESVLPSTQPTPSSLSVTAPQPPSKVFVSSSSPNNAPNTDNKQTSPPPPSTIQKIEHTLTGVVDKLNPLN